METSGNRDMRTDMESKLEDWVASIIRGEGRDAAAQRAIPADSEPELQIAVLSLVTMRLGVALKAISSESRKDVELESIADKLVELTNTLSELCRAYIEARAVSAPDEKPDLEQTDLEEELSAEPNAAEEWLASGVADPKPSSKSAPTEQPTPASEPVSPGIPTKAPQPTAPGLSAEEQLKSHLFDLQKATSWGSLGEAEKARRRVLGMSFHFSNKELNKKIKQYESRGRDFKRVKTDFESLLRKNDVLGKESITFWKNLRNSRTRWFIRTAEKMIESALDFGLVGLLRTHSPQSSRVTKFINQAQSAYGNLATQLPVTRDAHQTRLPDVDPGVDHRIPVLQPSSGWTLYIDETGARFGDEQGKEGRVVGLLLPENTTLAPLPTGFHAVSAPSAEVLHRFNQLLETPCGIFGLGVDDLHQMTQEHWLASVLEVVNWVWRLLPLPEEETPVTLNVLIENKGTYDASKDLEWLQTGLAIAWDKESPHRNRLIRLGKLDFVPKDTGLIGWVDLVAYGWGTSKREIKKGMKQSRLMDSCLLRGVRELLPIWSKAINGKRIEAHEWQRLTEQKDAERKGSLTEIALHSLKKTCLQSPEYWQRYVDAMNAYLAAKEYDLSVLETQANWLVGMEGIKMKPEMRFFWKTGELARYNHTGEISTQGMRSTRIEVNELSEKVGQIVPHARCYAMLRLAVADANAFDFKAAEECLAPWDPEAGGSLMGSAIWDGKILSSLGQYAAFQGESGKALLLFDKALAQFKFLEDIDPLEAKRQRSQTATYAAIAAMDADGLTSDERNSRMEQALGTSVLDAAGRLGGDASPGNRYHHHLLVRYLVIHGSKKQCETYRKTSSTWLIREIGAGAGHPWPLIQYYRWEMTKRRELIENIYDYGWGREQGATVKLIGIALGIASGMLSPIDGMVCSILNDLQVEMTKAKDRIDILLHPKGVSGLALLKKALPFNYR